MMNIRNDKYVNNLKIYFYILNSLKANYLIT